MGRTCILNGIGSHPSGDDDHFKLMMSQQMRLVKLL
jgi:hypothetical protein